MLRFAENLGFNFCAVTVAMPQQVTSINTLQINNYPDEWNRQYEQRKFGSIDPITAHCNQSMMPIVWNETLYEKAPHVWQALQEQGQISPLELYEHFGYIFYAASHLSELFARTLPKQSMKPDQPHLSPRELEVLQLSAGGKTAYEISKTLRLSERTVNYHVQNVIEKLNVCNKISAVIAAARAGII
ncbi:LuxR C-terminal-related transcriptional regulator [Pseudomonas iridis]|uniref:helix-turn-helix transcriptional regulator n=1 Tax=Pseudomonas iridis TaxID=2710587 RepID=UPI00380F0263